MNKNPYHRIGSATCIENRKQAKADKILKVEAIITKKSETEIKQKRLEGMISQKKLEKKMDIVNNND